MLISSLWKRLLSNEMALRSNNLSTDNTCSAFITLRTFLSHMSRKLKSESCRCVATGSGLLQLRTAGLLCPNNILNWDWRGLPCVMHCSVRWQMLGWDEWLCCSDPQWSLWRVQCAIVLHFIKIIKLSHFAHDWVLDVVYSHNILALLTLIMTVWHMLLS